MITRIIFILLFPMFLYSKFPLEVKDYSYDNFGRKLREIFIASNLFQKDELDNDRLVLEIKKYNIPDRITIYSIIIYGYTNRYLLYHDMGGVDQWNTDKVASRLYNNLEDSNQFKEQFEKYSELIAQDCLHIGETGNYCSKCGEKLK